MLNKLIILIILSITTLTTSCCSYLSVADSKEELIKRKVYASGDEVAIKAMNINGVASVGVDISNWEAIKKHPFRQLGAALLDLATVYVADQSMKKLTENDNTETQPQPPTVIINITCDNVSTIDAPNNTEVNIIK